MYVKTELCPNPPGHGAAPASIPRRDAPSKDEYTGPVYLICRIGDDYREVRMADGYVLHYRSPSGGWLPAARGATSAPGERTAFDTYEFFPLHGS